MKSNRGPNFVQGLSRRCPLPVNGHDDQDARWFERVVIRIEGALARDPLSLTREVDVERSTI